MLVAVFVLDVIIIYAVDVFDGLSPVKFLIICVYSYT